MSCFKTIEEAKNYAKTKNAEPLPEGKDSRVPFKVYAIALGSVVVYATAQNPQTAMNYAACEHKLTIELVNTESLLPVSEFLKRLSPEQLADARKYLGA